MTTWKRQVLLGVLALACVVQALLASVLSAFSAERFFDEDVGCIAPSST